jgi:hypothetical protein
MINEYKTRLFEKVKIYPSIRHVFLSMQNQLEVGCLLDTYILLNGVAVSFNVVKPDSGIEWKQKILH